MRKISIVVSTILFASFWPAIAQTTCPAPPNQVSVQVTANTSFDPSTQLYTYTYTLASDSASVQDVISFIVSFEGSIDSIDEPQGWGHAVMSNASMLHWSADVAADFPPDVVDQGQLPPAAFPVKPGTNMTGFVFTSPKSPGPVKYIVHGFSPIPPQASEEDAEQFSTVCALTGSYLSRGVSGTTVGPVNFVPVNISIKPPATPPVPMNVGDRGTTPVAILGSSTFDVSAVDISSVLLGPGNAAVFGPGSPGFSGKADIEDVNNDGFPDLVLHFHTQQIGFQCTDTSLLLTGKTQNGTPIRGTENIQPLGCQ
jgi:hypothetical protein